MFTGEIFQKPPQRSAVVRQTRTRTIYELELIEQKERLLLTRILCELEPIFENYTMTLVRF